VTLPPQESAPTIQERRAARRANQTTFNLVIALLASLGLVILIVVVVVRPDTQRPTVDWAAAGDAAQQSVAEPLAIPELPEGWSANRAQLVPNPSDGVTRWEIGFLTPAGEYIGFVQGVDANASWLATEVANERAEGTARLGGLTWDRYDRRGASDAGNLEYALSTVTGASTIVLGGTASDAEFETLAGAVAEALS
jgi:hypothetical protein